MAILSFLVTLLLTMVSYASGITLAARRREYPPVVLDLIVIALLWLILFWLGTALTRLPMLASTIALGIMTGYGVATIRFSRLDEARSIPQSELPAHAQDSPAASVTPGYGRHLWRRWQDFGGRMGNVQGRLLMGFFYFLIVTPFGLITRLLSDNLAIKQAPSESNWHRADTAAATLDAAREQG